MTQTCERYGAEAKYKVAYTATATTTLASGTQNTVIPGIETTESNELFERGDSTTKRKAGNSMNEENDLIKRQKTAEKNDEVGEILNFSNMF